MSPAARRRAFNLAPWIALGLTIAGTLFVDGKSWGQACERIDSIEADTGLLKGEMQELRTEIQAQINSYDERLRTVEQATEAIPGMAQDIRDIRNYLLEESGQP